MGRLICRVGVSLVSGWVGFIGFSFIVVFFVKYCDIRLEGGNWDDVG